MQTKAYTGIGSRETPPDIRCMMTEIGFLLNDRGFTLRSGGASGADSAFESRVKTNKEIYLPFNSFNGRTHDGIYFFNWSLCPGYRVAKQLVYEVHPNPKALTSYSLNLMGRNGMQILGQFMDEPSKFVLCWTKDGKASGGTGQAIRIAQKLKIRVLNLKDPQVFAYFQKWIQSKKTLL